MNIPARPDETPQPNKPSPLLFVFAAFFAIAMVLNMVSDGSDYLSIFLGSSALILLGVDVGKLSGRR